ncbi:MAG: hypothetical protein OEQ30_08195, partial [Gammaproteobacteria bacterium]|nr:hypothetical protein [Gammaproteobacteria bacterium]
MIQTRIVLLFAVLLVTTAAVADATEDLTKAEKISAAATENRQALNFDGKAFSGPAWDRLIAEGRVAQFFLVGEEHGIA